MHLRSFAAQKIPAGIPRAAAAVCIPLVLIGCSRLIEDAFIASYEQNWPRVSDEECAKGLAVATGRFLDEGREQQRMALELASRPVVQGYLLGNGTDRTRVFEGVTELSRARDVGVDIYDRNGVLVAWEGQGGFVPPEEMRRVLGGHAVSFVTRMQIASLLTLAVPVRTGDSVAGAVVIRKTIDASAPLNNPILRNEALDEQLTRELGVTVEFSFAGEAEPVRDGRYCTGSLYSPDSTVLGSVSVLRPVRAGFLEAFDGLFQKVNAFLILLSLALVVRVAAGLIGRLRSMLLRSVAVTVIVWGVRYGLLWFAIPSDFITSGVFDPAQFASNFGGGIAKSIGELSITTFALAVNVALLLRLHMHRDAGGPWKGRIPAPAGIIAAVLLSGFMYWLLRDYAAVIRSGVSDSSLTYFDARVLLPSWGLAFMVLDFFLLGACAIAVSVACALLIGRLCGSTADGMVTPSGWLIAAGVVAAVAIILGLLQAAPLMTTSYRLLFGAGILLSARWYHSLSAGGRTRHLRTHLLAVFAGAGIMIYPLLDDFVHEKDRRSIEAFAAEELKPVDGWLNHVVEEGLHGFDNDEYREQLSEGDAGVVAGMAFERWSSSLACSQGYDAMFTVTDPYGYEASRFVIGGSVTAMMEADTSLPMAGKELIRVHEFGTGVNALKVYAGGMPIFAADSTLLGRVRVVVAAGQQALFRGESPSILRGSSGANIESFYRRVTLSEYHDGVLLTSNNPVVPVAHPLPEAVGEAFADSSRTSVWASDDIDGEHYEAFYVRRTAGGTDVVALSLKELGLTWHLVGAVKLFAGYALLALAVMAFWRIAERRRGIRFRMTFRDRLLIALLVTAILPITLIAVNSRVYDGEREMETLAERLDEETQGVIYGITEHPEQGVSVLAYPADPLKAEELATEIGTDFNIYTDNQLSVSSRPQLYDVGILDRRLSGNIYSRIVLGGKRFVIQTERVGSFQYSVGYRPVLDANENIVGVVSVPTLFREEETEEQAARRNSLLLGTYAVVLLSIIVIASVFANRIASPVQRLTEATRRLAKGELDVEVPAAGAEGEISELIQSFDQMTHDLRRNREELVRYERDIAWKEMAKQVAHEIRNPLTPMRLSIQHLRRTYLDKAENFGEILDSVTRTVVEQIDTLSRIASEFSHFARMPRRTLERQDVGEIVDEAVRLFSQESNVRFETEVSVGIPGVMADREELRRAIINIIRNGIQAMDGTGRILIRAGTRDGGALVTIEDFGKGVPEEMVDKLFLPNFSTKTDGMGLGLAIVKKTIEDLHGTVTLASTVGKGTTVSVWLPPA